MSQTLRIHKGFPPLKTCMTTLWTAGFILIFFWQRTAVEELLKHRRWALKPESIPNLRTLVFNLTDFGGVGDGVTMNTFAFERAIQEIKKRGGGQLNVLPGLWLTAPFNLTSHVTLFLAKNAVILGATDEKYWPLMPPLPSYGHGREHPGPRYGSLIHGQNLTDVVITGHNGTINGQGTTWWNKYKKHLLKHTRGPLVQLMWCNNIEISGITMRDSPFWTLHPYDCKNVTIRKVTILSPSAAPNTDGIDPDSCEDMVIEDSYISVGDDGIAIKSGWDQYGIAYARPSTNILIRNLVIRAPISAGVSIGSELSGGVSNITMENLQIWDSKRGVRIKTSLGRGGYVKNIKYQNLTFDNVRVGIVIKTDYNEHPDKSFDRKAVTDINDISFKGIRGTNVRIPVRIYGSREIPVRDVTFEDMLIGVTNKKKRIFQCSFLQGRVIGKIFPKPCEDLDVYDEHGELVKHSIQKHALSFQ